MPPTSAAHDGRAARAPVADNAANWFTARQVSVRWGLSLTTVQRWIQTGKLAAVRLPNGHYRIYGETVAALEDELTA